MKKATTAKATPRRRAPGARPAEPVYSKQQVRGAEVCAASGCTKPSARRGLCVGHHQAVLRALGPLRARRAESPVARSVTVPVENIRGFRRLGRKQGFPSGYAFARALLNSVADGTAPVPKLLAG